MRNPVREAAICFDYEDTRVATNLIRSSWKAAGLSLRFCWIANFLYLFLLLDHLTSAGVMHVEYGRGNSDLVDLGMVRDISVKEVQINWS